MSEEVVVLALGLELGSELLGRDLYVRTLVVVVLTHQTVALLQF